jgi:integrase
MLDRRVGAVKSGKRLSPKMDRLKFDEAAADLLNDYRINDRRSFTVAERRIRLHLEPYFGGWRMADITTADIREYILRRQGETEIVRGAYDMTLTDGTVKRIAESRRNVARISNAEINRELALLRRMFSLAVKESKLMDRPHVPMLKERNTRTGFFERDQFERVSAHLPAALRPVIEFAYITGWRIASEILPLEWQHVDFEAGEVRLDPHTTKNDDGRVFPFTDDLRTLLETLHAEHEQRQKAGQIVPWVFVRMVAKKRRGPKSPKLISRFDKTWKKACRAAGCPGRIPHDLRRTAIRNMVRRGVPERVAMALAGHRTRSVFERYNIVSAGDLRTAARQLAGLTGVSLRQQQQG